MKKFKVISLDMFGTLVDADHMALPVWRQFLQDAFTEESALRHWNRGTDLIFQYFEENIVDKYHFVSTTDIFRKCYDRLFFDIGLEYDSQSAAETLGYHLSLSKPYPDVQPFLEAAGAQYSVCLSSDADDYMLGDLTKMHPFDRVFTSERLGAHKSNAGNAFFSEVIRHYRVRPEEIIHIGDSLSDVTGPASAGISSCWINRKRRTWNNEIKPDYQVESLIGVAEILGLKVSQWPL